MEDALRDAAKVAIAHRETKAFTKKPDGSLVTEADPLVEKRLREHCAELTPGTSIWGEELGFEAPSDGAIWLIDPIDGTTNYTMGLPLWGLTMALCRGGSMEVGGIYLPESETMLSASRGQGAFRNGQRMAALSPQDIEPHTLVGTTGRKVLHDLEIKAKLRHFGAFVSEFAAYAEGSFGAMLVTSVHLYDAAAGLLIARELGGVIRGFDGSELNESAWLKQEKMPPFAFLPPGSALLKRG